MERLNLVPTVVEYFDMINKVQVGNIHFRRHKIKVIHAKRLLCNCRKGVSVDIVGVGKYNFTPAFEITRIPI